ncbi:MobA/MobL family protein [Anaeroselena agilis]|uniref:MobA/MobL family protein n=1 Tax=Anaeroselena agilis TaxID=3063788 RepID=A0ABU3P548_9FIRM|nr:MobA/MobL family protein [Selenomonadales bacterium 4137-cl]
MRQGEYGHGEKAEELVAKSEEMENAPEWAATNPRDFWAAADAYERSNGRTYHEIRIALPVELTEQQNIELIKDYCHQVFGEDFPYEWAYHSNVGRLDGQKDNPHAHIMFSDRRRDGIERAPEVYFSEAAKQYKDPTRQQPDPAAHGARKDRVMWHDLDAIPRIREEWERTCNRHLENNGHEARIDMRSLVDQRQAALEAGDHEKATQLDREPEQHLGPDRARTKDRPPLTDEEIEKIALHRYTHGLGRELKNEVWDLKKEDYSLRKEERALAKQLKGKRPSAAQQAELDRLADARHENYKARLLTELRQAELTKELATPEAQAEIAKIAGDIAERDRQRVEKITGIKAGRIGREKDAAAIARAAAEKRIVKAHGQAVSYAEVFYAASDAVREIDRAGGNQAAWGEVEKLRSTLALPENHEYMPSKAHVAGDLADPVTLAAQAGEILTQLEREKTQRRAIEAEQRPAPAPVKDAAQEQRAAKLAKALEVEKAKTAKAAEIQSRAAAAQAIETDLRALATKIEAGEVGHAEALEKIVRARAACGAHLRDLKNELSTLPAKGLTRDEIKDMAWNWHHDNVLREHDPVIKALETKVAEATKAYETAKVAGTVGDKLENLVKFRDAAARTLEEKKAEIRAIAKADLGPINSYFLEIRGRDNQEQSRRATVEQKIDVFSTKDGEFKAVQRALMRSHDRNGKNAAPAPQIGRALNNIVADLNRAESHGKGGLNLRISALHQDLGDYADTSEHDHGQNRGLERE